MWISSLKTANALLRESVRIRVGVRGRAGLEVVPGTITERHMVGIGDGIELGPGTFTESFV